MAHMRVGCVCSFPPDIQGSDATVAQGSRPEAGEDVHAAGDARAVACLRHTHRVHVAHIWHILAPSSSAYVLAVEPMYVLYKYLDPLRYWLYPRCNGATLAFFLREQVPKYRAYSQVLWALRLWVSIVVTISRLTVSLRGGVQKPLGLPTP